MATEIIVRDEKTKLAALAEIMAISEDPCMVVVMPYKPNRSKAQNRLYWGWLTDYEKTDVNEHAGIAKEEWADKFKRLCLSKIFERDSEQYAATMAALRDVYRHGYHAESKTMVDFVIAETSTTDANVEQFSEYLNFIERYAHERGIQLRTDDNLYREAMNIGYRENKT